MNKTASLALLLLASAILVLSVTTDAPETAAQNATLPAGLPQGRVVDLTHSFERRTVYWPTARRFRLQEVAEGETEAGYFYAANNFSAAEHGGTHIDAPIHFFRGRRTTDRVPLEQLIGEAVVVDVSAQSRRNRDYQVTTGDLTRWESQNGALPAGAMVILRTGFGRFWPDRERYMGTAERGQEAVAKLHFPGLHPNAARWLVRNRSVKAVGLDTPSIDYGQSKSFLTHRILARDNVPAFENLANLDRLPVRGAILIALPMKIRGGSGGPLRAIAIVPGTS